MASQMESRLQDEVTRLNAEAQKTARFEVQFREMESTIEQLRSRNATLESMQQELKTSMRR